MQQEEFLKSGPSPSGADQMLNENWVVHPDKDLEDLIPTFLQNRRNELTEIDEAAMNSDFEFIRRTAHTWKGICRPYGFIYLETLSISLEVAGEAEDQAKTLAVAKEIQTYLKNVRIVYDA